MYSTNTVPADPLFCAFWVKEPTQIIFGPTHSHYPSEVHGLWIVRPVLVDAVHSSSTSNAGYGMSQQSNLSCLEILHSIYLKICQKSLLSHWPLFQNAITSYCASKWRFYYQQHLPSLFFWCRYYLHFTGFRAHNSLLHPQNGLLAPVTLRNRKVS